MNWFIDTDALSQTSKSRPNRAVASWIKAHQDDCYLSALTLAEVAYGIQISPDQRRPFLEQWLAETRAEFSEGILPVDESVLIEWKKLLRELQAAGTTLACEDTLLAAHARCLGFGILTMNKRHFSDASLVAVAEP